MRLFKDRLVTETALAIHQLCHMAFEADKQFGRKDGVGVFKRHPLVVEYKKPDETDDGHLYRFGGILEPFQVWSYDDSAYLLVLGFQDFHGCDINSPKQDSYIVSARRSLTNQQFAPKSRALVNEFVSNYFATDTSRFSKF